jgi:hypothetical protein
MAMKYLKVLSLILILLVACSSDNGTDSSGPEPQEGDIKVLFIGNSLTSYNQQPSMFSGMAKAAGKQVFVEQATVSGADLDNLSRNTSVLNLIKKYKWDYVILQGSDFSIAFQEYHFVILPGIETLRDSIKANNIQTDVIFFMNWANKEGNYWHSTFYSYDDFQTRIYDGTLQLADDLKFMIAPVGWAWKSVRDQYPDIELYASDDVHPSLAGSYLGACVYFAMIFIDDLEGVSYYYGLPAETGTILQEIGCSTVLNSLRRWNIY